MLISEYRSAWSDDSDVGEETRLNRLAQFADYLYCLPIPDLETWDRALSRELSDLLTSAENSCADVQSIWNPALLVVDHVQISGESRIAAVVSLNHRELQRCLDDAPDRPLWLDDFGTGRLASLGDPLNKENVLSALIDRERLGLGLCGLAEHGVGAHPLGCYRGFSRSLCTPESQASLEGQTTEQLLSLGLAEYRAESFEVSGMEGIRGHTADFERPESLFGVPTDDVFSTDRAYMRNYCDTSDEESASGPLAGSILAQHVSCEFRLILDETLATSLLEQQPFYVCDRASFERGIDLITNFPVRNPPGAGGRDPRCWAGQQAPDSEGGGSSSDDDDDDPPDWDVMSVQPRGSTTQQVGNPLRPGEHPSRNARYSPDDIRIAYETLQQERIGRGQAPLSPMTDEDFERIADDVNHSMQTAFVGDGEAYESAIVAEMERRSGEPLEGEELDRAESSWGYAFSDPNWIMARDHTDPAVVRRTILHEGMHLALGRMGDADSETAHSVMMTLGVWRPAPDSPGGSQCATAAEKRAAQLHECLRATKIDPSPENVNPLAPYIYVLNPPPIFPNCRVFYDPAQGYTDPSPIDDDRPPISGGPNYNDPNIGAIDPCPNPDDCPGLSARMPEGYSRAELIELLDAVRRRTEGVDERPDVVIGVDAEFSEDARN